MTAERGGAAVDQIWTERIPGWQTGRTLRSLRVPGAAGELATLTLLSSADEAFVVKAAPSVGAAEGVWGAYAHDSGLMGREIHAYRLLAGRGPDGRRELPNLLWSDLKVRPGGAMAIEYLSGACLDPGARARGLTLEQAAGAVECLARVHRRFLRSAKGVSSPAAPWLLTPQSEELVRAVDLGLSELASSTLWRGEGISERLCGAMRGRTTTEVVLRSHESTVLAVCHGDVWPGNILFPPQEPGTALLIDWQFAMWGNPMSDVALLLVSSLDSGSLEVWEDDLVHRYRGALGEEGVGYPIRDCITDLERARPFAGLVALATLGTYAVGMDRTQRQRLIPRSRTMLKWLADAGRG